MTVSDATVFSPGDVILLSYPFGEGAGVRKRPALVISSNAFNQETGELVVAQITSRVSAPARAGDYAIAEWRGGELPPPAPARGPPATPAPPLGFCRPGPPGAGGLTGGPGAPPTSPGGGAGWGWVFFGVLLFWIGSLACSRARLWARGLSGGRASAR